MTDLQGPPSLQLRQGSCNSTDHRPVEAPWHDRTAPLKNVLQFSCFSGDLSLLDGPRSSALKARQQLQGVLISDLTREEQHRSDAQ